MRGYYQGKNPDVLEDISRPRLSARQAAVLLGALTPEDAYALTLPQVMAAIAQTQKLTEEKP